MTPLRDKKITLGITGGIAAYKSCELTRLLVKAGADVHVVMSKAATEFIGPLTFETLSGNPVATDRFSGTMPHLQLTRDGCDLLLIAPATANCIAKTANGIADDLLSTVILGRDCPMAVAPAMNSNMWNSAPTQRNITQIKADGISVIGPENGELACRVSGAGRMAEPEHIVAEVKRLLTPATLDGKRILITAGPTSEAIDPVRVITNRSSGKQGYAIARAAFEAGADVTLISGPTALRAPWGVRTILVESACEMLDAVMKRVHDVDAFVSVAAVADWRPKCVSSNKIKKGQYSLPTDMVENPDILHTVCSMQQDRPFCIGFAAETEHIIAYAQRKLLYKGADLIIANDANRALGSDQNAVHFVTADAVESFATADKDCVAREIVKYLGQVLHSCGEIHATKRT